MRKIVLILLLVLSCGPALAQPPGRAVAIDYGESDTTRADFDVYRLGLQRDFKRVFWQGERARLTGYWEASVNYWDEPGDEIFAVALSPVFVLFFRGENARYQPYIEGGIGVSLLSDHRIGGRELSTHFQFEDRLGFGVRTEKWGIHYKYMHYSNGGIDKPNNGIDAHVIGMTFRY